MRPLVRPLALAAPLLAAAIVLAGCGITDPYASSRSTSTTARSQTATTASTSSETVTDPSEPPRSVPTTVAAKGVTAAHGNRGARSARQALQFYTRLSVNWTSKTIGRQQRELATLSEGTARAKALQAAASYGGDPLLQNGHVTNTGQIVSIGAGQGPERGSWVIVTSERTTGQGDARLPTAAHVTYAHVTHAQHGWLVDQWSPQN